MKNLLYKDYRLFWTATIFLYLLFSALLLIPNWPYFVAFSYIIWIAFVSAFFIGRSNQDIFLSVSLPVRKKDTVLARVCSVAAIELLQIIVAAPFAVINTLVYNNSNGAGMNPNFAFFGSMFIMYAIYNIIFLPGFYKTAYNVGKPLLLAAIAIPTYLTPRVHYSQNACSNNLRWIARAKAEWAEAHNGLLDDVRDRPQGVKTGHRSGP